MNKKITYGNDAQKALMKGIDTLANAVKTTLGARGRNVLIQDAYSGTPHITKDGVTVAKAVEVEDPEESQGIRLMQQVASTTNNQVGDGTTTSTILAQAIVSKGLEQVNQGANPIFLQRGINQAVESICESLDKSAVKVEGNEEFITQIATISANSDRDLGELIGNAFKKVGKYGVIKVEQSKRETYIEHQDGLRLNSGLVSQMFIDPDKRKMVLRDVSVLVTDHIIKSIHDFGEHNETNILNRAIEEEKTLVIICDEMESGVLQQLVASRRNPLSKSHIYVIKSPDFGQDRTETLIDIATITGGRFFSTEQGDKLTNIKDEELGTCAGFECDTEYSEIMGGHGEKESIKNRIETLNTRLENSTDDTEYAKELLQNRIAKMSGGVAIIYLGGTSETEWKEKKDRVDDAINATKAAIEQGVVAGGGIALKNCEYGTDEPHKLDTEELQGINIVNSVLKVPFQCILENAGEDVVKIEELLLMNNGNNSNYGYDVKARKGGDMFEMGILDPVKVTKAALKNAASVAGIILTTQCLITNEDNEISIDQFQNGGGF